MHRAASFFFFHLFHVLARFGLFFDLFTLCIYSRFFLQCFAVLLDKRLFTIVQFVVQFAF